MKGIIVVLICLIFSACKGWELNRKEDFESPFQDKLMPNVKKPRHWHHPDYR